MLAGGDDQRSLVLVGRDDAAERVSHARPGVDVYDDRLAEALGHAVGNTDDAGFLQRHHILEVFGKILEERLFRRAGIADDRLEVELAKQVEGNVLDSAHAANSPVR